MTVLNGVSAKCMDSFCREPDTGREWQISDGPYASGLGECLEFVYSPYPLEKSWASLH